MISYQRMGVPMKRHAWRRELYSNRDKGNIIGTVPVYTLQQNFEGITATQQLCDGLQSRR